MVELKPCTLIGSDKGGVGKSLLAQLMITAYDKAHEEAVAARLVDDRTRSPLTVIEIDHQRRLSSLLHDRVDLAIDAAPSLKDIARDRTIGETFLNKIYDAWNKGPSITDLGANVTTSLFDWARHFDIANFAVEDGIRFRFVAVTSPDEQALKSAFSALRQARQSLGTDTELFLVMNDTMGTTGYRFFEGSEAWMKIKTIAENSRVGIITLPFCDSMLMEWGRARNLTILDLLNGDQEITQQVAIAAGMDKLSARHQMKRFTDWIEQVQKEMHPLFARPPARQVAAA